MKRWRAFQLLAAMLCLSWASAAAMAGPYFVSITQNGSGTCDGTDFALPILISFNLPQDLAELPAAQQDVLNGTVVLSEINNFGFSGNDTVPATEVAGTTPAFPTSLPYTFQRFLTFSVNGAPISTVAISFSCSVAGMANVSVTTQFINTTVPVLGPAGLVALVVATLAASLLLLRRRAAAVRSV